MDKGFFMTGCMALALSAAFSCTFVGETSRDLQNMLIINEDNSHFFFSRTEAQMNVDSLQAFIDQYADSKVTHLFFCTAAQRASFRSKTVGAVWDTIGRTPLSPEDRRWAENAKLLDSKGLDPYKIWLQRCREKRISPWISMRMNDLHNVDDVNHHYHSDFWRNNPQFWRIPNDTTGNSNARALDYSHPEVQEYQLAFVRELFDRYDFDGFELDWMRFGYHFAPGKEQEGALNGFMQQVRAIADEWEHKRGHTIHIAARVPTTPQSAVGLGMDAVRWAKDGSVDLIIPTPFWATTDFDIPVEEWQKLLTAGGATAAKVALAPGIEYLVRAFPGAAYLPNDMATLYGFVASARYRGAKNIYFFNWMDSQTLPVTREQYRTLLDKGLDDSVLQRSVRRFPVTYRDVVAEGVSNDAQLPRTTDAPATFVIPIGAKLDSDKLLIIIGLGKGEGVSDASFTATINGKSATAVAFASEELHNPDVAHALCFDCPLQAAQDGYNTVTVQQTSGDLQRIVWAELRIVP
jgi:hypothetical protein